MEGTKGKQFRVRGTRREGEERRRGGGERERDLKSRTPLRKLFSFHESLSGVIIVLEKRESETLSTDSSPVACGLVGGPPPLPFRGNAEWSSNFAITATERERAAEGGETHYVTRQFTVPSQRSRIQIR